MIYVVVSSKQEKRFIKENLVKIKDYFFDIYENTKIKLIISGIGAYNVSSSISYICRLFEPQKNDLILNYGFAATKEIKYVNNIFRINTVKDFCLNKNMYFDLTYDLGLQERSLVTMPKPVENNEMEKNMLYDMEGYAFYQISRKFFDRQNIFMIKKISDNGKNNFDLKNIDLNDGLDKTFEKLYNISDEQEKIYKIKELKYIKSSMIKSNFTKVQKDLIIKKLYHFLLDGKEINNLLDEIIKKEFNNKRERNCYFEQIIKS
ncbi:hypothetical protein [Geotoga petraea]|uniref:Nucleoside phosphorylase n=1 Tax=Geotoga petraea TaxID=28234 RepID=A0A4Z0VWE3_9BACT|nr:hypothetical protein [Geotoga petraea]TGG88384.1 hypothetical protein E4650_04900 [Geotoga petraea]